MAMRTSDVDPKMPESEVGPVLILLETNGDSCSKEGLLFHDP